MLSSNDQDHEVNLGMECRICHSKTTRDLIISPCLCRGSMGCVHIGCLEQWLNFSSHNFCELCSYKFEVVQVRRYSFFQSILVWIRKDHTSIYKTLLFLLLSTVNSALLSWLWFLWISSIPNTFFRQKSNKDSKKETKEEQENDEISKTKWIIVFIFLTLLTVFSVKSLCFDVCKIIRSRYNSWHSWWNETVNVQLVVDLQNYKINAKLEKLDELPIKNTEEPEPLSTEENTDLQVKISNSQYEHESTYTTNNFDIVLPHTCAIEENTDLEEIKISNSQYGHKSTNTTNNFDIALPQTHTIEVNTDLQEIKISNSQYGHKSTNTTNNFDTALPQTYTIEENTDLQEIKISNAQHERKITKTNNFDLPLPKTHTTEENIDFQEIKKSISPLGGESTKATNNFEVVLPQTKK